MEVSVGLEGLVSVQLELTEPMNENKQKQEHASKYILFSFCPTYPAILFLFLRYFVFFVASAMQYKNASESFPSRLPIQTFNPKKIKMDR